MKRCKDFIPSSILKIIVRQLSCCIGVTMGTSMALPCGKPISSGCLLQIVRLACRIGSAHQQSPAEHHSSAGSYPVNQPMGSADRVRTSAWIPRRVEQLLVFRLRHTHRTIGIDFADRKRRVSHPMVHDRDQSHFHLRAPRILSISRWDRARPCAHNHDHSERSSMPLSNSGRSSSSTSSAARSAALRT